MIDQPFVNKLTARLAEQEARFSDPKITSDQQKFRALLKDHSRIKKIHDKAVTYLNLKKETEEHQFLLATDNTDIELKSLVEEEIEILKQKTVKIEHELMIDLLPPDPDDERNIIMEIRAGTGGQEAALFAGDLSRMYTRYAETLGWKTEFMDAHTSEKGGYKEIIFAIIGEYAYRTLRYEGGTHRVQRIPVTEASGRIHTSTATVAVLPEAEPSDEIDINPEDLRVDVYRASGAGGQHVNKTDSAVRITHLPSGIAVACQEERSQHKNRAKAMRVLRSRLLADQKEKEETLIHDSRKAQIGTGERSERIRTYNFPQNRMTDHRINYSTYNLDKIMEGELDDLFKTLQDHYLTLLIKSNSSNIAMLNSDA